MKVNRQYHNARVNKASGLVSHGEKLKPPAIMLRKHKRVVLCAEHERHFYQQIQHLKHSMTFKIQFLVKLYDNNPTNVTKI